MNVTRNRIANALPLSAKQTPLTEGVDEVFAGMSCRLLHLVFQQAMLCVHA